MTTISAPSLSAASLTSNRRRLVVILVGLAIVSFFNLIKSGFNLKLRIDGDLSGLGGGRGSGGREQRDEDEAISPQYSTSMSTSISTSTNPSYRSMKEVPNESPLLKKTKTTISTTKKKVATKVRGESGVVTTKKPKITSGSKPATSESGQTTQQTPLKKKTISSATTSKTKKDKKKKKERPANWVATTPDGIKLDEPFVEQRHYCLSKAREKHIEALGPIIFPNEPQPRELLKTTATTTTTTTTSKEGTRKKKVLDVLLVDPGYHGNVGDHMLTTGTHRFIHDLSSVYNVNMPTKQCHLNQADQLFPYCTWSIKEEHKHTRSKIALWQPGGNWGDLWYGIHKKRIESFSLLLENGYNIVQMPQSLYYKDKDLANKDALELKDEVSRGLGMGSVLNSTSSTSFLDTPEGMEMAKSRITLTWRERSSLEEAKSLYPYANNMLLPDTALRIGPFQPIRREEFAEETVDILCFLRTDLESKVAHVRNDKTWIERHLPNLPNNSTGGKPTYRIVDWQDRLKIFNDDDKLFTETSIQLLSLGKVVVADRLHASILAYLSGVPFVYIDQVSGKVTKALDGAFQDIEGCLDGSKAGWAKAGTLSEALEIAGTFL